MEEELFAWRPCGEVLPEHAHSVVAVIREIHQRHGYALYLLDGRQGKPLGSETRRIVVDALRPMKDSLAVAAFGISWLNRTSGILLFSAARVLTGFTFPFRFSSTEAEARAFLNEYREGRMKARDGSPRNAVR